MMCLDACIYVYVCEHMYTRILAYFVFFGHSPLCFKKQGPSLNPELINFARLAGQQTPGIRLSSLSGCCKDLCTWLSMWAMEKQVQIIMLIWKISTDQAVPAML